MVCVEYMPTCPAYVIFVTGAEPIFYDARSICHRVCGIELGPVQHQLNFGHEFATSIHLIVAGWQIDVYESCKLRDLRVSIRRVVHPAFLPRMCFLLFLARYMRPEGPWQRRSISTVRDDM